MRRPTGGLPPTVLLLAALALVAFLVRLEPIGLGLLALTVAALVALAAGPRERDAELPHDVHGRLLPGGDERTIDIAQARLLGQLDDPTEVQNSLRPRLRALVVERLARRGLALGDPSAREVVGEPLWTFVTGPPITTKLPLREFEQLLTRVEHV
ncbi:hypothetical protein ACXR2U_05245 [Jatrophihabitans sp. YIM 134969]